MDLQTYVPMIAPPNGTAANRRPAGPSDVRIICQRLLQPTGRSRRRSLSLVVDHMSTLRSFAKEATRPVLAVTALVTSPFLVFAALGIITSFSPNRPDPQEFGPAAMIPLMLLFVLCIAVVTFGFTAIVAIIWYLLRQAWRRRELRLIGKRFGWTPQTK